MRMFRNIIWNKNKDQKPEVYGGRNFVMWKLNLQALVVALRNLKQNYFFHLLCRFIKRCHVRTLRDDIYPIIRHLSAFCGTAWEYVTTLSSALLDPTPGWQVSSKSLLGYFQASFNLEESGKVKNEYLSKMGIRHFSRSSRKISL